MVTLGTNVTFFGNCRQAIDFYRKIFEDSKIEIITFGEVKNLLGGENIVGDKTDYIYSARFELCIQDQTFYLFLCDSPSVLFSSQISANKDNITIMMEFEDENDVIKYYDLLMENGKSNISPRKNMIGIMEGSLIDQFGVCWIIRTCR